MKNHALLLLLFLSGVAACASGQDTLFVNGPFKNEKAGPYIRYFKTDQSLTISSAAKIFEHNLTEIKKLTSSHLGIGTDNFWFSLRIKNQSGDVRRLMLELKQSHLTRVSFFEKTAEGFIERHALPLCRPPREAPQFSAAHPLPTRPSEGGFCFDHPGEQPRCALYPVG